MQLPVDLAVALEEELQGIPAKALAKACEQLSSRYRSRRPDAGGPFLRDDIDIAAYAAYRVPATYAATQAAAAEVRACLPEWSPRTVLDVGAGLGTAAWAATEVWPGLERSVVVEKDERMIACGRRLAERANSAALRGGRWQKQDGLDGREGGPFDLAVMGYMLGELPWARRYPLITQLWASSRGVLLIVEPGTPVGSETIREARKVLIGMGAVVIAPCPHSSECPLAADDWCHFSQRIARTRTHRSAKQARLGYEDEKFAYVAVAREAGRPIAARVLRHPQIRSGHVRLELCTREGRQQRVVSRREGEVYRRARGLRWGSAVEG